MTPHRQDEKEAKDAERGMWSLGDQYISPKEWRKMHR
jgi:endonuclease YncB( thermonuclease family)